MKLEDYIHYYIGCNMMYSSHHEPQTETYKLTYDTIQGAIEFLDRPILRKIEDITDEEIRELINYEKWESIYDGVKYTKTKSGIDIDYVIDAGDGGGYSQSHHVSFILLTPQQVVFFTKKGFDMFNLINAGLAIDAKTL
jgi:hypothetical protein